MHQISRPVESTFGFVQQGSTWKEHAIKYAKVQKIWAICPAKSVLFFCLLIDGFGDRSADIWKGRNMQDIF